MTEMISPKSSSSYQLRSGVDTALLRQLGGAATAIFLLQDYDKFGLTERVGYHFDLTEALGVAASAGDEESAAAAVADNKGTTVHPGASTSTITSSPITCGVASLLECAPATPWHRLSKRQKRALKSQLRAFNATAESVRSNTLEDILCYQPTSLPLRLNPSTRLFFAYEVTRIAFCVDASPSMTSTFGAHGGGSTTTSFTPLTGGPSGCYCCPLDRLPDMARTFFTSLVEPVSAPSLAEDGVWKPILAVTVLAVFPLGKKAETSLLVRDYRVDSVAAAQVLADQIRKWLFTDVEVGIAERLTRRNTLSTWSMPLYSSSLRDILDACDAALNVLSSDARPVIVVATDGRSMSCDGVVNVFLDIDRVDIPVIVLDVSLPETHAKDATDENDKQPRGVSAGMKTESHFLTYDPAGPSDFPLYLSDDIEALHSICRATAGYFVDHKMLEETAKSIAGQQLLSTEIPTPYNFSYKRRFAKMNGVQWLTLFSLSPLSPTFHAAGVGKLAPPSSQMQRNMSAGLGDSSLINAPDLLNFSRHDSFATRVPKELHRMDSAVSALSATRSIGNPTQARVTFSTYFISPVRIKALLMMRIKEGYRAKHFGSSTKDGDKVFIQFVLALDHGTALHYEISFKSLPGQIHEVGSAHIKIELSGDANFVQAVKKDFLAQNSDVRPATMAQRVSARLCQVMRWIRREDILQSYLSPPAKWTDQLASSESPLARRLGTMTRLQRRRHFRADEFDVICTGLMPYMLEGEAIFSEFASIDNGEQELLDLIQNYSTQVINRDQLRFVKARTSKNGTTSYFLMETRQSNIAPRLFTITLEFFGGTDPRARLRVLADLKKELDNAKDVDVLGKQMGQFLLGTTGIAHNKTTVRNVEFQYHHAQWELVKDPELLPLLMKRRTEIGRFRLIQSNDVSAIFAKVVPENVVDAPGDLVQYQIAIHPEKVLVDLHMESECGVFFPFSLAASDTKKFNGMVHVLRRRDQECGRALRSRTNLLSVFTGSKRVYGGSVEEPHAESVKRMLQYSSRITRKIRFFRPSTGMTNSIYYDITEELLLSKSFDAKSAKLSIDPLERVKDEEEGLWFVIQFDRATMSIIHLSSMDRVDESDGAAGYTYRNLTLFTSGISDLYSKRDDTNDDDSVDSHISEYMCVTEFLDHFEAAVRSNFASAAYQALRSNVSTISHFERDDLDVLKNSLEFVEVANLVVEGNDLYHDDRSRDDSKLVRLIQTILTQVPGDDECLFYSGTECHDETFHLSDDESGPSLEVGDVSVGDSQESPDAEGFLDLSTLLTTDEDAMIKNTGTYLTTVPIFVRFKVNGEIVPFPALNTIERSSTLSAEVSIYRSQLQPAASVGVHVLNLPSVHQAVASELNILLKWYVAEQTIERLRLQGSSISQDDLKVVQKCMKRVQSTISFSIEVFFYIPKMDIMVPASAPAGGESQVAEGFALLHDELRRSRSFRFHQVSSGGYFVAGRDQAALAFWCFIYCHENEGLVSSQIYHPEGEHIAVEVMNRIHDTVRTYIHRVNQQLLLNSLHRNRTASRLLIPSPKKKVTVVTKSSDAIENENQDIFIPGSFACPIVFRTMFDLFHRCAANPSQVARTLEATVLHSFAVSNRSGIFVYKDESDEIFYMRLQARGTGIDGDGKVELLVHGINKPGPSVTQQLKVLLQRRLLMIAVEMLSAVLTKNPHFRVTASDLDFLRSFDKEWTSLAKDESTSDPADAYYEFPAFVNDPTMVLLMFRQNLCGSTFFHRLNDIGYERLSPSITEARRLENGGSVLRWNNHDFTLYYNNAATTLNQSFQGVSTLTEKGAELSRQTGNGIAMIEILLVRADGAPLDEVIFARPASLSDDLPGLEKSRVRFRKLPEFPEPRSSKVCVRIRVTDTALSRKRLHEWIELSLNQAMTSWIIERRLETSITFGQTPGGDGPKLELASAVDDNQKQKLLEGLCPGLPSIRLMLEDLHTLPHPAVSNVAHHGVIRSSTVATKTLEMLERCIFSTLYKDLTSDGFRSARSNLRIVRTSRSSAPELVQLSWDPSKRRAVAHRQQEGSVFHQSIHDSPIDCPEYLCFFQLNPFGDNPQNIEQNIRLYKEVMIHDGISDRSATIELLESLKASNRRAFSRSFAFVFSVKRNRRILATYNWIPTMVASVRNRLQELEKSSLETVGRSSYALQSRSLKLLSPPTKVQETKAPQPPTRTALAVPDAPQMQHSTSTGAITETTPGPRRRIPRPVTIRQPKLIGKSVDGAAMQAVAASRKRASSNQFKKNLSNAASGRRSTSQATNKEGGKGSSSKSAVVGTDGGSKRAGRPSAGTRRSKDPQYEEETSRIKADFNLVAQQRVWTARRQSGLQRDSTVFLSNQWWPRSQTQIISLSLAEFVISKSPMAWCDACRFPPFPSGLDSSFVPIFARWMTAFAPNIDVLNTGSVAVGTSKAEDSIILASVIKNVRGIKGLAVVKISKINGKRAAPVVRCQGWIVRLPRRTRRESLKKSNHNVINTSFKEKDATGLDKLASDVHRSLVLEGLLFDFSASTIERAVRFLDARIDYDEVIPILRGLMDRYTLEQQRRIPMLNYRVFEANLILKSYKNKMIDKFDSLTLLQGLRAEAEECDLIQCGASLCFRRGINVKGSQSLCFLTPDPLDTARMRLIILCRTQGHNLSDYMFREGSNVAIHIIDNIVLECAGLIYEQLSFMAEKLHKNAMWKSLSTRSVRPTSRKSLEYVEEMMELCSVQPVLHAIGSSLRDGTDEIMETLLGPQSAIDWKSCCQAMKKELSFGPNWSFNGRCDAHLFFFEPCGIFLFLEITPGGQLHRADLIEKEANSSGKSRLKTIQIFMNFLLHFLWQSL